MESCSPVGKTTWAPGVRLTAGLILLLTVASCGAGLSDADKTATTLAPTATAQAQATADARAQATATARARPTATPIPAAQHWLDIYGGLPDALKARIEDLDAGRAGEDQFVEAMSWMEDWELTYDNVRHLIQLFRAIGEPEVTFVPIEFYAGAFPTVDGETAAAFFQARGLDIDEATIKGALTGTAFLTGDEIALLLQVLAPLAALGEGGAISEPPQVEVIRFFAHLPPDLQAQLDARGWTQERMVLFLLALEGTPTLEEIRSFFGPLSDTPIPPFAETVASSLEHTSPPVLGRIGEQIGERALVELMVGGRAPTGAEFLAVYEARNPPESPGEEP